MRVHILQHVPFEDIGSIAVWLDAHGADVSYTRFFVDPILPELDKLELIIAMGGPMSVKDESVLPWLRAEKNFIYNAVKNGIPVLGICLGAQLIASALGSKVYRNQQKEIGWFPIQATQSDEDTFGFPDKCTVFHWHSETYDLPAGAKRLAKSAACLNQAFQVGRRVIGLQFHLETTEESIKAMVENCKNELESGLYVQTESDMLSIPSAVFLENNSLMDKILSFITRT